jgi:hypothetical protein
MVYRAVLETVPKWVESSNLSFGTKYGSLVKWLSRLAPDQVMWVRVLHGPPKLYKPWVPRTDIPTKDSSWVELPDRVPNYLN